MQLPVDMIKTEKDVDEVAKYIKKMLKQAHEAGQEGITLTKTYSNKSRNWRPEGWSNPHEPDGSGTSLPSDPDQVFEAGADAILAAIEAKGQFGRCVASYFSLADHGSRIYTIEIKTWGQFKDPQSVEVGADGVLVFIPTHKNSE
jgi:hypothetical protein